MLCGELFRGAGIPCPKEIEDAYISSIVTDSKKVTKDCIFICLETGR